MTTDAPAEIRYKPDKRATQYGPEIRGWEAQGVTKCAAPWAHCIATLGSGGPVVSDLENDAQAQPVPTTLDPREQATVRLAEAEAQVERTTRAEREHLLDMHNRVQQGESDVPFTKRIVDRVMEQGFDFEDQETLLLMAQNMKDPFLAGSSELLAQSSPTRPTALRKTMRTLTRYRRDAESARRSALKAWLEAHA